MTDVNDLLRDADPLRHEAPDDATRARVRRVVMAASQDSPVSPWRRRAFLGVSAALVTAALAVVGVSIWPSAGGTLHAAAIRFEIHLAENEPGLGLREVRGDGGTKAVYLHNDAIVSNGDILQARVVAGKDAEHFNVAVVLTPDGARRMLAATTGHIGRPVAILVDNDLIAAPTVRSAIAGEALITGDFSRADAERIAAGISVR